MKTIKLLVTALAVGCCGPSAQSLANTVTSLADDGSPGTLRAAIAATPSGGTINFAVTGTITLTSGPLAIGQDLNILGPGPASLIILGNPGGNRVCYVGAGAHVNISGLTISGGYADFTYAGGNGGGIRSEEHTSELPSLRQLVCRLLLQKKRACPEGVAVCLRARGGQSTALAGRQC